MTNNQAALYPVGPERVVGARKVSSVAVPVCIYLGCQGHHAPALVQLEPVPNERGPITSDLENDQ
jgi:hypothetical protein